MKKLSSKDVSTDKLMYLAYTKTTNSRSNMPLQSIELTYGTPCAFNKFSMGVLGSSDPEPIFYPLEKDGMKKVCQDFYPGPLSGQAIDERYMTQLTDMPQPNEYEIQLNSGVYATLTSLSRYEYYNEAP